MENSNYMPLFYQNPVVLDRDIHSALTISASPNGYSFAAKAQTVILATVEFFDAGREYPIIFNQLPDGRILPLALMGIEEGENLFVSEANAWLGNYIPAYIRRYPFIHTDETEQRVLFDEAFDGFNLEGGIPLFDSGEPTQRTQEILAFLKDYYQQMKSTEQFGALLAQAELLKPIDAQMKLDDGRSYALKGMLVVDEQRLTMLPDSDIVRLFRGGWLALIYAHLLSLKSLSGLMGRK